MPESRLSKSIKNLRAAWIGQFLNIFAKFVMRRFFVKYISTDYLGLDAVFNNIIGLMNLAELGIGSAIFYALYGPLADEDEDRVLGVMQLLAKVYRTIAFMLTGVGLILMPLLTIIAPEARGLSYVHLLFGFYLINTVVSYLFTYKGLLASADQKSYITTRNHYVFIISLNIAQIFIIYFFRSFIMYAAIQSLFTVVEGVSLSWMMDKEYPILRQKRKVKLPKDVTKKIWSDVRKIVVSKVGNTVISSTDNLILSNVVGLAVTGIYSNYALIKASLQAIVCQFQAAVSASVGNIAALGEREKEIDYFWFLNFITTALYAVTSISLYNLMQPFIAYWLGVDYLMDQSVLFLTTVIYYLFGIRGIFGTFSMAHGVFDLEAKKTVLEAVTNLLISVMLATKMGVVGVLLGTVVSSLFVGLPFELINVGHALPEISKRRYMKEFILYSLTTLIALVGSSWCCEKISMHWYIRLPLGFFISVIVFMITWWLAWGRTEMSKRVVALAKNIMKTKFLKQG